MSVILVPQTDTFDQWRLKTNNISLNVGDIGILNSDELSLVRAINENYSNIGLLESLSTDNDWNLVSAITEVDNHTDVNTISIGDLLTLSTIDKSSVVNSINEVYANIGNINILTTDAKTNLVSAVNEIDSHTDTNTENIGDLPSLDTTIKDNIVVSINEVVLRTQDIGTLLSLTTDNKDNNVSAINEVDANVNINATNIGDMSLSTTATDLSGAVNELNSMAVTVGSIGDLTTDTTSTIVGAINELDAYNDSYTSSVGDLSTLDTGDKTNLVAAINEVVSNTITMALVLG